MNSPRILIIGKNGQVGHELIRTLAPLGTLAAIDYPEIDLTQPESIRAQLSQHQPSIIVNAAAHTAVDRAETEETRATQINGTAPGILAEHAKSSGALLIHYSTDYVYDGAKTSPYVETDHPNPLGAYGRSKLAGDLAIASSGCDYMIFRLCWVYGSRGANFMLTMMRLAREREQLRVVADQSGCPTWCRMIAEATALALMGNIHSGAARARYNGVYHLAASGSATWHDFAEAIIQSMPAEGKKCSFVQPITTDEYPLPAKRPPYSVLNCDKLYSTFGVRLPDWRDSLRHVIDK